MTAHNARFTATTLNSPDPPALARFYACLLGWEIEKEDTGWVTLPNPDGGIGLSFHIEDVWTPPTWPSEPGKQIMQMHLEILVDDLAAGCAHAQACGARMADYQPQDHVRVHLDPDGHPFCIYIETPEHPEASRNARRNHD
jgi:catechol 2,3-dioxygenase-like lactoylglutathione lyase family enzyme